VLLVEAIEKSANVTLFAEHAISDVDGTFIAFHDRPPREWISASPAGHFVNGNLEGYEVKPSFPQDSRSHSLIMIRALQRAHRRGSVATRICSAWRLRA
jgi:hypothetical protein